jgi:hypothetical protein
MRIMVWEKHYDKLPLRLSSEEEEVLLPSFVD